MRVCMHDSHIFSSCLKYPAAGMCDTISIIILAGMKQSSVDMAIQYMCTQSTPTDDLSSQVYNQNTQVYNMQLSTFHKYHLYISLEFNIAHHNALLWTHTLSIQLPFPQGSLYKIGRGFHVYTVHVHVGR